MNKYLLSKCNLCRVLSLFVALQAAQAQSPVLVVHGGAGDLRPENFSGPEQEAYRAALRLALEEGYAVLESGGTSLEAVRRTVRILEDSPLFNAGRGAVLNASGYAEMDAAVMDGATRKAGTVAALQRVRNPIEAAYAVMETTPHVMLCGAAADDFARRHGLAMESRRYFITEKRREQLRKLQSPAGTRSGTVGAVALDRHGNIAAATSTGGMANKLPGRVGDTPVIGAGTYADNRSCGVSATGHGEAFIRTAAAHEISALMLHGGHDLGQAVARVIHRDIAGLGSTGGIIALDRSGQVVMDFNTAGMFRGVIRAGAIAEVFLFKENQ
jgi:L-asparaginase / beta-aspartyl-peptidase